MLTLELRRELAERLSSKAIRSGKNIEAVVIDMLEAGEAIDDTLRIDVGPL